jgi:choline dehydrogenase-like flavoprotein
VVYGSGRHRGRERPHRHHVPSTHAYGGTRMGDNRETNVVNRWGFSHEVPNLGILGASVMGTSGAHNPTLTAQALAWRTAEHLTTNWRTIANQ